jgi:GntR family transcriptional regulator/MocR family aminotransferase
MLTYHFKTGGEPLYVQLYDAIKGDILSGVLMPGEALPGKRPFAKHLGISVSTVENAYGQLMAEGYITSMPRRGFYVAEVKTLPKAPETVPVQKTPDPVLESLHTALRGRRWFADFQSNQTDPASFPFTLWAKLTREVLSDEQDQLMTNPPAGGTLTLRTAIADHLRDFRGLVVAPEQIIVGAGTEYLYTLLIQLLGFDRIYAVESPGYRKILQVYQAHRLKTAKIPLDHQGLRPDRLEASGASIVHITPSHHFPTGITMPIARRYEMLSWANQAPDRLIIEDDYDSEFRMTGRPLPPLAAIDMTGRVIYMNTFTKSLASTVRVSYMVLPPALTAAFYRKLRFYACTVSTFEQAVLARFIAEGHYEKHLNRMRQAYRRRRDVLLGAIGQSPMAGCAAISEENAGLHFVLSLKIKKRDEAVVQDAAKRGIRVAPLEAGDAHRFLINYSSIPERVIPEAVRRLSEAVLGREG